MTTPNRAALLNKIYKVLKRAYKPNVFKGEQPLLETMLLGSCLENAHFQAAEEGLAKVKAAFFDLNEIRVSTVKELAEILHSLPEPAEAAARLKGVLQSVFESDYSFDLEHLKRQNIGAAVKRLQKLQGATPFNVAFATQISLGGHSIPVDRGALGVLYVLGAISEAEQREGIVPGMERAIPKSKGQEFGSLLHELGADFVANPFSPSLREFLLSIAPDAKERFPKRTPKKPPAPEPAPAKPVKGAAHPDKKHEDKKKDKQLATAKKPLGKSAEKRTVRAGKTTSPAKKKPASAKKPAKTLAKRKPR